MKRAKNVWGREISSESRAVIRIEAAVTRQKARSFMRKGRRNSISYRRSSGHTADPPSRVTSTAEKKRFASTLT
jgi:hypothetical protein